jgi:hypothetical protein
MASKCKSLPKFEIGSRVRRKYDGAVLTVCWVSKGGESRVDQLIATEANSYTQPSSNALCFEAV